jgi:PAS domain S-box-containing protein
MGVSDAASPAEAASLLVFFTRDRLFAAAVTEELAQLVPGTEVHVLHEIDILHDHVAHAQPDGLIIDIDNSSSEDRSHLLDTELTLGTATILVGTSPNDLAAAAQCARQPVTRAMRDSGLPRLIARFLQTARPAVGVQRRLRETVQHYRDILDASSDGIFVLLGGVFTYVNESFTVAVGRPRRDLIGQLGLVDLADAGDRSMLQGELARLSVVGGKRDLLDVDLRCGNDVRRHFEISCRSSLVAGRRTVVGVARDVTTVVELQEEIEAAHLRAAQVERQRALGELAAGVAHDFNNALDAILGRVRRARQRLGRGEVVDDDLAIVEQAASGAAQTVRRISEFARPAGGESWHDVDLGTAVRDAAELALHNLLTNAVDSIADDGWIALRTFAHDQQAVVEIEDSGCGMTPDVQRHAFEPFFTTKGEAGTGLGLSVTHGILRRHDAEVQLHSEPGRGTRFRILFPSPARLGESRPEVTTSVLRILVVDDDTAVAELMRDLLLELGHRVVVLGNARDAVAFVAHEEIDILITDLDLPQASGWQVARNVRRLRPGLCVGLVTGWPLGTAESELRAKGVDFVLSKPFSIEELSAALTSLRRQNGPSR